MTNNREQTHKDLCQLVARKIGNFHRPATYIDYIKEHYDIEVSNASVCKSLGSTISRLQADEPRAVEYAKKLLEQCYYDKALASFVLSKAAVA
jgi:aminoglycoside phosphotransferase family enzyme